MSGGAAIETMEAQDLSVGRGVDHRGQGAQRIHLWGRRPYGPPLGRGGGCWPQRAGRSQIVFVFTWDAHDL